MPWSDIEGFISAWITHYGSTITLITVGLRADGELIGDWPIVRETRQLGGYWESPTEEIVSVLEAWRRFYA